MHTDELLESCLQALCSGEEIPPEISRYLARHPAQRAEVEELIFIAQRSSHLPLAELSVRGRKGMRERLALHLGIDLALLDAQSTLSEPAVPHEHTLPSTLHVKRTRLLA